jgi:phenylalanyl-tRNA synthetase beta chain
MVGAGRAKILDRLPYVGLDIEGVTKNSIRVEYSPNRPDFGSDFGVARAIRGLLGKELGLPRYRTGDSGVRVSVDRRLSKVRPFIACLVATGLRFDHEDIKQIISLQEDLHNGLGRKRKVVAIGLHDMDALTPPLSYKGVASSFRFVPLDGRAESSIGEILSDTNEGRSYGSALGESGVYPVIVDSKGVVLSFPPIINGNATRVTTRTKNLFVDVTSTDMKAGDDVLAILATTLAEAGAKLGRVEVGYSKKSRQTPDLSPEELPLDLRLVNSVLGMELCGKQVADCLARSRLSAKGNRALAPRYRVDLLHPVDIAEEVALGYGIDRIGPLYPASKTPGYFNKFEEFLDSVSTVMAGSGMIETMTYELTDEKSLYVNFGRSPADMVAVHDPRSLDHSVLRDALIPTLTASLTSNVRSDYPQRIFEVGRVYSRTREGVCEAWHLGSLVAHSQSTYSEAKMYLEAVARTMTGREIASKEARYWAFAEGRSASVHIGGRPLGFVGELGPETLSSFGITVPISGFEIDLSKLHEQLK